MSLVHAYTVTCHVSEYDAFFIDAIVKRWFSFSLRSAISFVYSTSGKKEKISNSIYETIAFSVYLFPIYNGRLFF